MRTLTLINGMPIDGENLRTIKFNQNIIVREYAKHWDKVHLIGPLLSDKKIKKVQSSIAPNIYITGINGYDKSLKKRVSHFFGGYNKTIKEYIIDTGILEETDSFYFMFPNYWAMMLSYGMRKHNVKSFFYMASELEKVILIRSPFVYPFARLKNVFEAYLMKGKPLICTGDVIANRFNKFCKAHPYYSTTHNEVVKREPRENYTNLLYVGSFLKWKRVIDLLGAINILKKDYPNIKCDILGSGPESQKLMDYVKANQLEKFVNFPGWISSKEEIVEYFRKADFLIHPSLAEGTPRVFPEAMSHGVIPLTVRDISSNNYIITPYKNGALFTAKSPQSIAQEMRVFLEDRDLYEKALDGIYDYAKEHTLEIELKKVADFVFKELDL